MQPRPWKRPESVLVVVATRSGEVLLMQRTRPTWFWQSVTGSLEWGESPLAAARRELAEETGLTCDHLLLDARRTERFSIVPPWRARYAPGAHENTEHLFYCLLPSRRTIRLKPKEHRCYRWLPLDQAARRASSWTNRKAILQLGRL